MLQATLPSLSEPRPGVFASPSFIYWGQPVRSVTNSRRPGVRETPARLVYGLRPSATRPWYGWGVEALNFPSVLTRSRMRTPSPASESSESAPEAALEGAWARVEQLVADRLRGTTTTCEFEDRLDQILDAAEFYRLWRAATALIPSDVMQRMAKGEDVARVFLAIVPSSLHQQVEEGARLTAATAKASLQYYFAVMLGKEQPPWLRTGGEPATAMAWATNPRIPGAVKRAVIGGWHAEVCVWAMLTAPRWGASEPLLSAVVGRWIDSLRRQLGYLAALPGVSLLPDDLRGIEVLDLNRLVARHAEAEDGYQRRLREAVQSGLDVYPPFGPGDE